MLDGDAYSSSAEQYDEWFDTNPFVCDAELRVVRSLLVPTVRPAMEVGVGTGRFAALLGIRLGIDPSEGMLLIARRRGVTVARGVAENLPVRDLAAGCILMATAICFVSDAVRAFEESFRVLERDGAVVIGMLDRASPVGRTYGERKQKSPFYRRTRFYPVAEVLDMLRQTGFRDFDFRRTIFEQASRIGKNETVRTGHGEGFFAVIRARKD
jgi:ubiquinone/menaquinone biosynthesis C-methylase UbiE